jgi:Acetyltransferase (GNAT) family
VDVPRDVAVAAEVAEAGAWADVVRGLAARDGNPLRAEVGRAGAASVPIVRGLDTPLINRVLALGVPEPAAEADVDEVLALYRDRGLEGFAVAVAPHARPGELAEWLGRRGLARSSVFAKFWRSTADPPPERTALRIEPVGAERAGDVARVSCAAWLVGGAFLRWFEASVGRPRWRHYLAFQDERPVATAALFVSDGAAWLGFAATLPQHRSRGAHASLLARRIRDAAGLGCEVVVTDAREDTPQRPSPSYRNILGAGFRFAYVVPNYAPAARAG